MDVEAPENTKHAANSNKNQTYPISSDLYLMMDWIVVLGI